MLPGGPTASTRLSESLVCCAGEGLLSPSQVLVALHSMRTGKDGVPLLAVMTALTVCLSQRQTFNRAAIAVALEQLVDRCRPHAKLQAKHGRNGAGLLPHISQSECCQVSARQLLVWVLHNPSCLVNWASQHRCSCHHCFQLPSTANVAHAGA